jgi:hypothetical protein
MNVFHQYRPLVAALMAASVILPATPLLADDSTTDSGHPVMATEQAALPGTGPNQGDNLRAQMQASPGAPTTLATGQTIHDSFGSSLIAREVAAAPGTGPNSADLARADLQADPASFAALGTRFPVPPGASSVATIGGRAGWSPALAELQATPKPLPWATRVAKAAAVDKSAKVDAKP